MTTKGGGARSFPAPDSPLLETLLDREQPVSKKSPAGRTLGRGCEDLFLVEESKRGYQGRGTRNPQQIPIFWGVG